jgi:hypothetical protein
MAAFVANMLAKVHHIAEGCKTDASKSIHCIRTFMHNKTYAPLIQSTQGAFNENHNLNKICHSCCNLSYQ